jgi:hypothetical protein
MPKKATAAAKATAADHAAGVQDFPSQMAAYGGQLPEMPAEFKGMSLQEIQLAISAADLQMKMLELDRIKDENAKRIAKRDALIKYNAQIQQQMQSEAALIKYAQSVCRHRQGGKASSDGRHVWAGDGKPCIVRTQMLDGVTWLMQCIRCRLKVFTPHPQHYKGRPDEFARDKALYEKLWELSADSGLDEIKGPTFQFTKDGVPYIPERI